jgi:hypothetical protein
MSSTEGPAVITITVAGRTTTRPRARSQRNGMVGRGERAARAPPRSSLGMRRALRLEPKLAEGGR